MAAGTAESVKATKTEGKKNRAVVAAGTAESVKATRAEGKNTRDHADSLAERIIRTLIDDVVPMWLSVLLIILAVIVGIIVGLNVNANLMVDTVNVIDQATGTVISSSPKYSDFVCKLVAWFSGIAVGFVVFTVLQAIASFAYKRTRR